MIGWLLVADAEVPRGDGWLRPAERETLAGLVVPKRRADWRRGRRAAKLAVAAALGIDGEDVEVRAAADGAPEALITGMEAPVSISISHSTGHAACAVGMPALALGCDVELVEARAAVFADEWFTAAERRLVAEAAPGERNAVVTLIWSAKESALKAVRAGLRRDPRSMEVSLVMSELDGWRCLRVEDLSTGSALCGWCRRAGDLVLTLVTADGARGDEPPVALGQIESLTLGGLCV